ncbi:P-loop ATPase, Sll1717 family, partial [Treponema denticola]
QLDGQKENTMLAIKDLNLGFADAENYTTKEGKKLFHKIFVKNDNLDKLLLPSTYYLIGDKGTGKTAYSVFLSSNEYKNTRGETRFIREIEYQKFLQLKKSNNLSLSDYVDIWKVCLLTLAAGMIEANDLKANLLTKANKLQKIKKSIKLYYDKAFSPEIIYALNWIEDSKIRTKIAHENAELEGELGNTLSYVESKFQVNLLQIEKSFKEALNSTKLKKNIVLFIDGIDLRPDTIPYDDYIDCIKGLANAAWSLNKDFFGKIKDTLGLFRIVLLIRPDIFNVLRLQNSANKMTDNSVFIDTRTTYQNYQNSELFKIADRLLSSQQDGSDKMQIGEAWFKYLPWHTNSTNRNREYDDSFINILRKTYSRPRDLMVVLKIFKDTQEKMGYGNRDVFLLDIFLSSEFQEQYSNYMLSTLRDQLSFFYTNDEFNMFIVFFEYLHGKWQFTYEYYKTIFERYVQENKEKLKNMHTVFSSEDGFLQLLYETNVICYIDRSEKEPFYRFCYRQRSQAKMYPEIKKQKGQEYSVHYGLQKVLNLGSEIIYQEE